MDAGNSTVPEGSMAKAIYDQLSSELDAKNELGEEVHKKWKGLSYAIAYGVVEHLKSQMVIQGIQVQGTVTRTISGTTGESEIPVPHTHDYEYILEVPNVTLTQSNDGTGRVA